MNKYIDIGKIENYIKATKEKATYNPALQLLVAFWYISF